MLDEVKVVSIRRKGQAPYRIGRSLHYLGHAARGQLPHPHARRVVVGLHIRQPLAIGGNRRRLNIPRRCYRRNHHFHEVATLVPAIAVVQVQSQKRSDGHYNHSGHHRQDPSVRRRSGNAAVLAAADNGAGSRASMAVSVEEDFRVADGALALDTTCSRVESVSRLNLFKIPHEAPPPSDTAARGPSPRLRNNFLKPHRHCRIHSRCAFRLRGSKSHRKSAPK